MLAVLALGTIAVLAAAYQLGGGACVVAAIGGLVLGGTVTLALVPRPVPPEALLAAAAPPPAAEPAPAGEEAPAPEPAPAPVPAPVLANDPITGLPEGARLQADLQHALDDVDSARVWTLYVFALDGFKDYNDAYGDPCGDALLGWLARKLSNSVAGHGTAYRVRGGSFALLAPGSEEYAASLCESAVAALRELGDGFHISCSVGKATLPGAATTADATLELALRRAHSQRRERKAEPGLRAPASPTEALRLVRPRYDVAAMAKRIARRMELPDKDIEHLESAVHLCDVGNLAVPRDILGRPGKLPEHEWRFILLHTLVGERLLAAGLGMEAVATLVRSSHERWDGSGYPDGLAGEAIPLGSRIVFVCSAFHDMISERPHSPALEPTQALAELERGAGTQFDPDVVNAFREDFEATFVPEVGRLSVAPPEPPAVAQPAEAAEPLSSAESA
jgi:diguanylate cyclase (GGDEF)-like protein